MLLLTLLATFYYSLKTMHIKWISTKKLRSKPSTTENITYIVGHVERKLLDMQPILQGPNIDKSKIQKTLVELKTHIEHLQNIGENVNEEHLEKIKEITRKYKEASTKYENINDISHAKSPMVFRKKFTPEAAKEPLPVQQSKVALGEVEEKLKSMRQKRLDRLSVFVTEQSKLSEERNKSNEISEIENAIKSIQKTDFDRKVKTASVENMVIQEEPDEEIDVKTSPKINRTRSNESTERLKSAKGSSTMRFINKFNCTLPTGSSNEDLTKDSGYRKSNSPSDSRSNIVSSDNNDSRFLSNSDDILTRKDDVSKDDTSEVANPLLSPFGKLRRAVYMYEHECQFLEKEKRSSLPPMTTFGKESQQSDAIVKSEVINKTHTYENQTVIGSNGSVKSTVRSGAERKVKSA
ncbi:hypothetical protein NQ317_005595 [Molorchus minor]|uniref:Uncharacterized protein n=1 Tax=Molorchus minor TaxID=1323400 RepID=A0ABQ9K6B0_9CUCU|nr:hypothetical protein NQ317_005595 [Molorchus minor]